VPSRSDLIAATLLGLGGGLRAFATPVALAVHHRGPLAGHRRVALVAAAGELGADKYPGMASRWSLPGMSPRLLFSGVGGRELAGWRGAAVAAVAAVGSAYAGSHLRPKVHGGAALVAAVAEDALSYALVLAALRDRA
jgi:hypothetical protein